MKKLHILILTLVLGAVLSFTALAQTCSGEFGSNLFWTLDTNTGALSISGSGEMPDFGSSSHSPWYLYNSYVKSVDVSSSVTHVGSWAFNGCTELTSVTLQNGVSSIGAHAFDGCKKLTSVTLPATLNNIGEGAFYGCGKLSGVELTGNLAQIYYGTFSGCSSLTSVTIPETVTSIGSSAFSGCESLTEISIPSSVTSIGDGAFYNCTSLACISIEGNLSSIGSYVFNGTAFFNNNNNWSNNVLYIDNHIISAKTSLTGNYTIPNGIVCISAGAFKDCIPLRSVSIPEGIKRIPDNAFAGCSSLTAVAIPTSVTSIGEGAFAGCSSLAGAFEINEGIASIGEDAFFGCNITEFVVNASNTVYSSDENGVLFNLSKTALIQYPQGSLEIAYAIPATVSDIEPYAFANAKNLKNITCDGNSNYASINGVLFNSAKTTLIRYPAGNTAASYTIPETVTAIENGAFSGSKNLSSLTLATGLKTIGFDAFYGCSKLLRMSYGKNKTEFLKINGYSEIPEGTIVDFPGLTNIVTTSKSKDGDVTTIVVNTTNVPYGCSIVVAYYNGTQLVGLEKVTSRSNETAIKTTLTADTAYMMVLDSLRNLVPLCAKVRI